MKNLLRISLMSLVILMTSCEEEENCLPIDAAGTYKGTIECDEMYPENITFEVSAGDSDIQIIIDGIPTIIDECDIFGSTIVNGTGREIDGDIDEDKISLLVLLMKKEVLI